MPEMSVGPFLKIQSISVHHNCEHFDSHPIQSTVHSVGENTIKYVSEFDSFLQLMLLVDS